MNKSRHPLWSESGQGIVEYILLLVVVVTLAFALAGRFFKPFAKWAQFYIGDYVECLLDQGELPSLGGQSTVQDCVSPFQFSPGEIDAQKEKSEKEKSAQTEGGSDSSRSRSTRGGVVASGSRGSKNFTVGGMDGGASDSKVTTASAETRSAQGVSYFRANRSDTGLRPQQGRAQRVTGLSGLLAGEREKIKKRENKVQKVASSGGVESVRSLKKFPYQPPQKKNTNVDFTTEGWSFGKLFRILLIIVIAIALILFIMGQLVQISKSMEK